MSPQPGETIADIGCGAGQTVLQLAPFVGSGGQIIGVDIAPLLLNLARLRTKGLRQVRFVTGDAAHLDLPAHSIDISAHDAPVSSGDVDAMAAVLLTVGLLGRILRENPHLRADAEPRMRAALQATAAGSDISLTAATWIVTARA